MNSSTKKFFLLFINFSISFNEKYFNNYIEIMNIKKVYNTIKNVN